MPKEFLKKVMPSHDTVRNSRCLQVFGTFLHSPNLWHLNRHAVARAFAIGLFWALIPVPFQMVFAAGAAIMWRANFPLSVSLVWLTNPITMPPIFFAAYSMGAWLLGSPPLELPENLNVHWFLHSMAIIWKPLFLGSLLSGFFAGLTGYFLIHYLWRWQTVRKYRARKPAPDPIVRQPASEG